MRIAKLGAAIGVVGIVGCSGSDEGARFAEAVSQCEGDDLVTGEPAGASARYAVKGPTDDGRCRVSFTYLDHPNADYVGKQLSYAIATDGDVESQIRAGVAECLQGRAGSFGCRGELYRAMGGVPGAPDKPMTCGEPVELTGGEPLHALPKDGAWGYVNGSGEWIIEPRWTRAGDFSEGRAIVASGGAWGVIDRQGEPVVEPGFSAQSYSTVDGERIGSPPLAPFSEGCAAGVAATSDEPPFFVGRDGAIHWRDEPPEALAGLDVKEYGSFSDGLAWFRVFSMGGGGYGWIDAEGRVVIEPEFAGGGRFVGGLAPAARDRSQWGFINASGELAMPGKWTLGHAGSFSDGLAYVDLGTYDYGYLDREGNSIDGVTLGQGGEPASIREGGPFSEGLAPVITDVDGRRALVYLTPEGTAALIPDRIEGIRVCAPRSLPAFRDGMVRLLVADDGADCGQDANGLGLAEYTRAHYVYLNREGEVVLEQPKLLQRKE